MFKSLATIYSRTMTKINSIRKIPKDSRKLLLTILDSAKDNKGGTAYLNSLREDSGLDKDSFNRHYTWLKDNKLIREYPEPELDKVTLTPIGWTLAKECRKLEMKPKPLLTLERMTFFLVLIGTIIAIISFYQNRNNREVHAHEKVEPVDTTVQTTNVLVQEDTVKKNLKKQTND